MRSNKIITNQLISEIMSLHSDNILLWETTQIMPSQQDNHDSQDFMLLVTKNHVFNYQLWHAEDKARRTDKGFAFVYQAKREIDQYNQQRNNYMEAMDKWLFIALEPSLIPNCPVHSETPGMIIDRLAILSLKVHYMRIQATRTDTELKQQQLCQNKLQILLAQQEQLICCLKQLFNEIKEKTRTFKIYHQFKMYNDPALNPQLYKNSPNDEPIK